MIAGPTPGTALRCPKCALAIDPEIASAASEVACPACRSPLSVRLFPAFTKPPDPISTSSGEAATEGEAACFFHPGKRAAVSCEQCGRFLCALCDVPLGGRHLCPSCLNPSKLPEMVNQRVIWSQVAMYLGLWPFAMVVIPCLWFVWFLIFITGPAAIFVALWKWKAPGSLINGQRHGLAIAGIIGGLLQIAGVVAGIWLIVWSIRNG